MRILTDSPKIESGGRVGRGTDCSNSDYDRGFDFWLEWDAGQQKPSALAFVDLVAQFYQ